MHMDIQMKNSYLVPTQSVSQPYPQLLLDHKHYLEHYIKLYQIIMVEDMNEEIKLEKKLQSNPRISKEKEREWNVYKGQRYFDIFDWWLKNDRLEFTTYHYLFM